jgi:L-aminopeptidase/D-esterase-like protein
MTLLIGHYTDAAALTGCTVILFDRPLPTVVDVRGGSPGTRETDLLSPGALVGAADAILFTGGSALGLGAAQGVVEALRDEGRGVPTAGGPVPIVPAAVIYDLAVGRPVWPTANDARAACHAAVAPSRCEVGSVGAGTGATTNKLEGSPRRGGVGIASRAVDDVLVWVLAVVNAAGSVGGTDPRAQLLAASPDFADRSSTVLVAVVILGPADDRTRRRCAVAAHDGMARVIVPCHTIWDGDVVFVSSQHGNDVAPADVMRYSIATELAVEDAIRIAVSQRD